MMAALPAGCLPIGLEEREGNVVGGFSAKGVTLIVAPDCAVPNDEEPSIVVPAFDAIA